MSTTVINHQQSNLLCPDQWVAPKLGLSNEQYMCIFEVEYHLYMNSSPHNHLMINTIFQHFFKCGEIKSRQLCVKHINDSLSSFSPFKLVYTIQHDTNQWTLSLDQMNHKPRTMPPTAKEQLGSSSVIGQKRPSYSGTELKEKMRKKFSAEYMELAEETHEKRALDKLVSRYHLVKLMLMTGVYTKGQGSQLKQALIQQVQDFSDSLQKVMEEGDNDVTQWHHKFNAVCFAECSNSIMSMLWSEIKEDIAYELSEVKELQKRQPCVNATRLKIREVRLSQYLEAVKVVIDYDDHQPKGMPLPHSLPVVIAQACPHKSDHKRPHGPPLPQSVPVEIAQARPRESAHKRPHGPIKFAWLIDVAKKLKAWGEKPENVDRIVKPDKP